MAGFRNGRNVRAVAEIKLQVFGLDRHIRWEVGAYGEEHDERADLVALALERAGVPAADTVLIGDTPADVAAGLQQGVRVLAVASGHSSEDVLRQAGADVVLSSLEDPRLLVKLVRGHDVEA
ncbi:HAD hydrolase-like protein [Streptomyces sp. NBC_01808]|uniref:HAD family hydrolase n=1 Tax=Streptomyces sp. NBC_01808 TaxID=2975947 RepID=UPI002DDBE810|nr:HAD hydrolase-like protein [Streptomyces sp. NBC_01808]WSA38384.1 HAD hydrolase-like protein [Streptomyces sp. NBC_01808]